MDAILNGAGRPWYLSTASWLSSSANCSAGPPAALRLADLGARVVEVERPMTGDASRQLTLANQVMDQDMSSSDH